MMVPVGRLTVMKIVPREQYMSAMTFVTLPGQIGPLLGPALGGILVEYASWHWIFLINIPVGIIGAIATLLLMPNYTMQTRRFDFLGFVLLAVGMATLTLALDGQRSAGGSPLLLCLLILLGVFSLLFYLMHGRNNDNALFSLKLFDNRIYAIGLLGSFTGRIGSGMLPFMTPILIDSCMIIDSRLLPLEASSSGSSFSVRVFMDEKRMALTMPCNSSTTGSSQIQPSSATTGNSSTTSASASVPPTSALR